MLSAVKVSPEQAAGYYYAEDYTQTGHKPQWFGQGAVQIGLEGEAQETPLRAVLYGKGPHGEKLRAKRTLLKPDTKGKPAQHVAATDLTFSAPKSVSLTALVIGDDRVLAVHRHAVDNALSYLETHCSTAKVRTHGQSVIEKTGNIIAATFEHHTNRNQDPQLHTHCLVMNTTQCTDHKWRSMRNQEYFKLKRHEISKIYKSSLVKGLEKLGYHTERYSNDTIGIRGFLPYQLTAFSTRRQEILEVTAGDHWKARQAATLITRNSKNKNISYRELTQLWRKRAISLQIRLTPPLRPEHVQERGLQARGVER